MINYLKIEQLEKNYNYSSQKSHTMYKYFSGNRN